MPMEPRTRTRAGQHRVLPRAVAIAAIVVAALTAGCGDSSQAPSASLSPTGIPAVTASPAAVPTTSPSSASPPPESSAPPAVPATWSRVPKQPSVSGVQFQLVVWTGTRFVATGTGLDASGVLLDSADGLTWHRQTSSLPTPSATALAAGPLGVVAVASTDDGATAWVSGDGLTWTRREDAFPAPKRIAGTSGSRSIQVTGIVATDDGWLAVGREDPDCQFDCGGAPLRAIVWKSPDGLAWKLVADQKSLRGGGMNAVARFNSGFVAVGLRASRAAVWTSPDGSAWSLVPDAPLFHPQHGLDFGISMGGVAADQGVVVAVGMDGLGSEDVSVRAWWSADGRMWHKATGQKFKSGQVFSVTSTPLGFLATGPSGDTSCLGGIWESIDGRTWTCTASGSKFAGFGPYAAAASTSVIVAVGLDGSGPESDQGLPGAVWWKPLH